MSEMRRTISHGVLLTFLASGCGSSGTETSHTDSATTGPSETGETTQLPTTGLETTTSPSTSSNSETLDSSSSDSDTTEGPACGSDIDPEGELVPTQFGPIQGSLVDGVYTFLGVPYAAPPVGELRLRPPEDPTCWDEPLQTTTPGNMCTQLIGDQGGQITGVTGDEDCLTLNIWTPETGDMEQVATHPVMVYIHGGGNAIGSGSDPLFDGAHLAATGDVVVVTLNYRLAALGYLTHEALAAENPDGVAGNYATRDQIKALQWVQTNIGVFGGDKDNVTIFGESAGAVNTCTLVGSPLAAGLFDQAIIQSGGCGARNLSNYKQQVSDPWIQASGCADEVDVAACLRSLPAEELVQIEPNGYPNVAGFTQGFGPHIDGHILTQSPLAAMEAGEHNHVPLIIGANADETARSVPPLTESTYTALVNATFGILGMDVVDQILELYSIDAYGDATSAYIALTSDIKFICAARTAARAAASGQPEPVYRYHFAFDDYTSFQERYAFHGLELFYIFGNFNALMLGMNEYMPNPDDLAMAAIMQATWLSFAVDGNPDNTDLGEAWPTYDSGSDPYMLLDLPPGAGDGVRTVECDFWDSLLP